MTQLVLLLALLSLAASAAMGRRSLDRTRPHREPETGDGQRVEPAGGPVSRLSADRSESPGQRGPLPDDCELAQLRALLAEVRQHRDELRREVEAQRRQLDQAAVERAELRRLKILYNNGQDFPHRDEELRGGRPIAA